MKKIIKTIPSFITSMNLLCGTIATIMAINGEIRIATILILLAAVFDFFDGFVARLLKATSEFGVQMDSLADLISFGFAPTALLYNLIINNCEIYKYFAFISVLIVIFSALRLAKFNTDSEQSIEFKGLPTPASALFIISICEYCSTNDNNLSNFLANEIVISIIIISISALMVSNIRLMSLKIKNFSISKYIYQIVLVISAIGLIILFRFLGIGITIILYILFSIIRNYILKSNKNEIHSRN
ncbi:MAG: CDP-diacylglycerol--serine O-phosphatidyltransferase [Bacteroidales bacterium]|jgi:CDP-diacylglycerol--serine O-phosphatidyltransferase|nr:CDP-diacylglycerol--serine O-phosphatidyltransferase [Bacteroidales bacterium]